jgi:hypothetical protein
VRISDPRHGLGPLVSGWMRDELDHSDRWGYDVDVPLIVAGSLAVVSAVIHGVGGEALMRRISPEMLPPEGSGGRRQTKMELHVNWQLATITFLVVGVGLLLSGSVLDGDSARALGLFAAGAVTGFAVLAVGLVAAYMRTPRSVLLHGAPATLTAVAALAWWGALSI